MKDNVFIDTNIVIYLYSEDEIEKSEKSLSVISENNATISIQVLNELSNTLLKKFNFSHDEIISTIEEITSKIDVKIITEETILSALNIAKRYSYSYYDSLIIASAIENKCSILYSEDMQHGQLINNELTIINPLK